MAPYGHLSCNSKTHTVKKKTAAGVSQVKGYMTGFCKKEKNVIIHCDSQVLPDIKTNVRHSLTLTQTICVWTAVMRTPDERKHF